MLGNLGKRRNELEHLINSYKKIIADDNLMLTQQNKVIVSLQEENRQLKKLLELYEACINKGVKIDFPNVTGKGGKTVQKGSKGFNEDNKLF